MLGGVDAGGQNVHVAELAAGLSRLGHDVVVYTRRDDDALPPTVVTPAGYSVEHLRPDHRRDCRRTNCGPTWVRSRTR